jgi:CDP-4-dehydro-6-deoxyglucose reductase, E1
MLKLVKQAFFEEEKTKKNLANFIVNTKQLSFGPECKAFEEEFARWQKQKYAVMFSSGSTANLGLIQALLNRGYLKKGDLVGFSAITWSTNVTPMIKLGLGVVPIDVNLNTLNVSPSTLEDVIKKHKIKAFFITHVLGFCDDMEKIVKLCKKHKVILLEDTCEALGSEYKKKKLGSFGLAGTFSFYVGHHLSTIEGGMVITGDKNLAEELRMVRSHGWDRHLDSAAQKRLRRKHSVSDFYGLYTFYDLGNNFRPTEINGFLGRTQLPFANTIVEKRQYNYKKLIGAIHSRPDLYYPQHMNHMDVISNFAFPVITKSKKIQNSLIKKMKGKVEIRPVIAGNMVHQPFYKKHVGIHKEKLENADLIHKQGLYIGNNPDLKEKELKFLITIFTSL